MPVQCTFLLNGKTTSTLVCSGFGGVEAYSGHDAGRDNSKAAAVVDIGPIPPGTYYIIDRQSGGVLGSLHNFVASHFGSTDREKWFMLWNAVGGDTTVINGVHRGNFRLHPEGPMHLSDGCITVKNGSQFESLQRYIRSGGPTMSVPGSDLKAYGTVSVR
ncbi:hypothetical protein BWP39_21185 [Paraburkholderia acidicola]|uniref:Tlde1 domain-containing protein n=2 Tax=Paraburkholderia acidicola TaxID=1912599 RepID=A0A2A4EM72_9BURK|nr:hypothetical protein BWP39_21185 [Paraburkholderia acidicola]